MVPPLIEIKTVPIEIQMKTTNPSVEYTSSTVEMKISRSEQGTLDVKSGPIHVQLDMFQPRGAFFQTDAANPLSQSAQTAQAVSAPQAVSGSSQPSNYSYEATAAYMDQGSIQLVGQYAAAPVNMASEEGAASSANTPANTTPKTAMNVKWENGAMQIRYNMQKLYVDWKIDQGEINFTPGDIEFTVAQRPSIRFKYTGGPLYVPPSSNPNYKPPVHVSSGVKGPHVSAPHVAPTVEPVYKPVNVKA